MLRAERISRGVDRRRSAILEVARDQLSRDGIAAFTMERVADEAGYARTAIYRYFSSGRSSSSSWPRSRSSFASSSTAASRDSTAGRASAWWRSAR